MNTADPASPQPDAARWIASNTPCLGCLHQYVSHHRDFGECALCGCVSFKNPEDQPEPAPPSAGDAETPFSAWWRGNAVERLNVNPHYNTTAEYWARRAWEAAQRQHAAAPQPAETVTWEDWRAWRFRADGPGFGDATPLALMHEAFEGGKAAARSDAEAESREALETICDELAEALETIKQRDAALEAARAEAARLRKALERFYADSCDCWRAVEQKCHWCEAPAGEKHADDCPWPQGLDALAATTPAAPPGEQTKNMDAACAACGHQKLLHSGTGSRRWDGQTPRCLGVADDCDCGGYAAAPPAEQECVYVLLIESDTPCGTVATIEAVYANREHAEKHANIINARGAAGNRGRVCDEPLVMEDRYPMLTSSGASPATSLHLSHQAPPAKREGV